MKPHKVKCSLCANGVTIVRATANDNGEDPYYYVFAGKLEPDVANELGAQWLTRDKNLQFDGANIYTVEEIKNGFMFQHTHCFLLASNLS